VSYGIVIPISRTTLLVEGTLKWLQTSI